MMWKHSPSRCGRQVEPSSNFTREGKNTQPRIPCAALPLMPGCSIVPSCPGGIAFFNDHGMLYGRSRSCGAENTSAVNVALERVLFVEFFTCSERVCGLFQKSPPLATTGQARLRRGNGEDGHHSRFHVIFHVAVEQPGTGVIGGHIDGFHAAGQELNHIGMTAFIADSFAMPVRRVKVNLVSHGQQIPADFLALLHGQAGKIAEDEPVDAVEETLALAAQLIEDLKRSDEFAIHIFGGAVGVRLTFRGHDDRPKESGIDLDSRVNVWP